MRVLSSFVAGAAVCGSCVHASADPIPADEWAAAYRNWTYYPDWIIPPSCVDVTTCTPPYINNSAHGYTDIFQVWSASDPFAPNAPSPRYIGVYTFFDGVGYQTAYATSDDLLHFSQPLSNESGIIYSPRSTYSVPNGTFDYGGAAFVGPILTDYNITSPRVLARAGPGSKFWYSYFAQPSRNAMEPPPGATGMASSTDGLTWTRETPTPILDTNASHGAQPWEQEQIYAPYLWLDPATGELQDFYNARVVGPWREQTGVATLPGGAAALPGLNPDGSSQWVRYAGNPIVANGPVFDTITASDPKVYWDASLDGGKGAYVMFYFGLSKTKPYNGANIDIAFSRDGRNWTKASQPLYLKHGHPAGYDACDAHKAWLTVDETGRKYMYYTGDGCQLGRGILLLTSTPLEEWRIKGTGQPKDKEQQGQAQGVPPAAAVAASPITAPATLRDTILFNYAWRFHYGPEPGEQAGPGSGFPVNASGYNCTSGIYPNPNRFANDGDDCGIACSYNPNCYVWVSRGNQRTCFHGGADAVCFPNGTLNLGGMRSTVPPIKTDYAFAGAGYDASGWEVVDAPHDSVMTLNASYAEVHDFRHAYLPRNVSWYRKTFSPPMAWRGSTVHLRFDGVFHYTQIWLNGQYIFAHSDGYTDFTVRLDNVSSFVWGGANVLAVRTDASYGSGHWYEGGGLFRDVFLVRTGPLHFVHSGLFVDPYVPGAGAAVPVRCSAEFESFATGGGSAYVTFTLLDRSTGKVLASNTTAVISVPANGQGTAMAIATLTMDLSAPGALWSIQTPTLYTVTATLVDSSTGTAADALNVTVGFRTPSFTSNSGFYLNGQHMPMRGFSHHNSFAGVGAAMVPRLDLYRAQALRALGANTWRMSHNPYSPFTYSILDTLGVIVWDENRDFASEYFPAMHDMVKRDRNHPAVVMWSICNEVECDANDLTTGQGMVAAAKALDPSRPTTANSDSIDGLYQVLDVQGFSHRNATYIEVFHGANPSIPTVLSECCSCTSQRLEGRNITTCTPTENAPGFLPFASGSLGVWTLMDYFGEPGPWPQVSSSFGQFDLAGFPKPHAWWYVTNWLQLTPASDVSRPPLPVAPVARVTDLLDQLVPAGPGLVTITGITSTAQAELVVDGASQGVQQVPVVGMPVTWTVSNANSAVKNATLLAVDNMGNTVTSHTVLAPSGPAYALQTVVDVPSPSTGTGTALLLDGQDVALVAVRLVDASGVLVTTAAANVSFAVLSGPGRVVGVGNGDPANQANPHGSTVATYGGLARVLVQVNTDCVSASRDVIIAVDSDAGATGRTTVVPPGQACPTDPIVVQASVVGATLPGTSTTTASIPVSSDPTTDSVWAVASSTVTGMGFTMMEAFQG